MLASGLILDSGLSCLLIFGKLVAGGFGGWFLVFLLRLHTLILNSAAAFALNVSRFKNSVEKLEPNREPMGTQMDAN